MHQRTLFRARWRRVELGFAALHNSLVKIATERFFRPLYDRVSDNSLATVQRSCCNEMKSTTSPFLAATPSQLTLRYSRRLLSASDIAWPWKLSELESRTDVERSCRGIIAFPWVTAFLDFEIGDEDWCVGWDGSGWDREMSCIYRKCSRYYILHVCILSMNKFMEISWQIFRL